VSWPRRLPARYGFDTMRPLRDARRKRRIELLYDESATTVDLDAASIDLAIVPVGAIEQHSQHLPLGTDWLVAQAVARRVAELLASERNVYLIPALPYSLSQCHGPMAGTLGLRPETVASVVRDVVFSLYRQGIRHVVILNAHGGNFVLDDEIRELMVRRSPLADLREAAKANGMHELKEDGLEKVLQGVTTPDEVMRVVFTAGQ